MWRRPHFVITLLAAMPCFGITIAINDPNTTIDSTGSTVLQSKYRMSEGNFDFSLSPTGGTGAAGSTFIPANSGNVAQLSTKWWAFSLTNVPSSSLTFTVSPILGNDRPGQTLIWGDGGTATLNSGGVPYGPQDREYNALRIQARATASGSLAQLSNLSFTSPGMTLTPGSAFFDMSVDPTTSVPSIPTYPADATGFLSQWIVASGNLAAVSWTLSGYVALTRTGGGDGEAVRLTIDGLPVSANYPAGAIPEPGAGWLMATAAAALLLRRSRFIAGTPKRPARE